MNGFSRTGTIVLIAAVLLSMAVSLALLAREARDARDADPRSPFLSLLFKARKSADKPGVTVLRIYGPIETGSVRSPFGSGQAVGSDQVVAALDSIGRDRNIRAVVLRIDSPGGTVGSVQEIYQKLLLLKSRGMKIVVSMADIAASGGYYIACPADLIVANPGTLTGSIGVIMFDLNLSGLIEKYGVRYTVVKSGSRKDIFSSFRPMSVSERGLLQSMVDDSFRQFLDAVVKCRRLNGRQEALISDGRVFTGRQAKQAGLVDELGGLETAVKAAGRLCGLGEDPVVYEERPSAWETFLSEFGAATRLKAPSVLQPLTETAGLRYQFIP